jgi:cyclin G-associated kinase
MFYHVTRSISGAELDVSYLTSRLAVMSYPCEGLEVATLGRNHVEDVRALLEGRHGANYAVYNVSGRSCGSNKFPVKVYDYVWAPTRAPSLSQLFSICESMYSYLLQDQKHACVVHCVVSL